MSSEARFLESRANQLIAVKPQQKTAEKVSPQGSHGSSPKERKAPRFQVPFTRKNYLILGSGLLILIIGYLCLAQGPHDGFLSLTLAPILLVLGFCVVIPYGIMARDKSVATGTSPGGD
ncbi:hypothetical protein KKH18_05865 [bacterium]|nr:hypothetical protein [bacterium]